MRRHEITDDQWERIKDLQKVRDYEVLKQP